MPAQEDPFIITQVGNTFLNGQGTWPSNARDFTEDDLANLDPEQKKAVLLWKDVDKLIDGKYPPEYYSVAGRVRGDTDKAEVVLLFPYRFDGFYEISKHDQERVLSEFDSLNRSLERNGIEARYNKPGMFEGAFEIPVLTLDDAKKAARIIKDFVAFSPMKKALVWK